MKSIILCLALFTFIECKGIDPCTFPNLKCGEAVEVGVYIESLCPWSKRFVNNQLFPTFNKLIDAYPPIIKINLVPFGKAEMIFKKNSTQNPSVNYTCQHKDQECEGNILQCCALLKYDIKRSLPFVNCMFNSTDWISPWISASECSQKLNLDFKTLSECANSWDGIADQYFMAGQTNALVPELIYVPWITINGIHNNEIHKKATSNLLKLVCDTSPGASKPKACDSA